MRSGEGYLSKREQQIMELIYREERRTATEVTAGLPGSPSNSTVRTLLRILEEKGQLAHAEEDGRYVYHAVSGRQTAAKSALRGVVETFFQGSVEDVVAALLSPDSQKLSDEELNRLQAMIDAARGEGK